MSTEKHKQGGSHITWEMVLLQLKKEHKDKGSTQSTTAVSLSVPTNFLREHGYALETEVDPEFVSRLEKALADNPSAEEIKSLQLSVADSAYRTRISALARGYRALTGSLFTKTLNPLIVKSGLTKAEISKCSHISAGTLHMLMTGQAFGSLPEEAIEALDKTLKADGALVAAYIAVATHVRSHNILPSLAGVDTFGSLLAQSRKRAKTTRLEVANMVGVSETVLRSWENGLTRPTLDRLKIVEELDRTLACGGTLVNVWMASSPAKACFQLNPYRIPKNKWPERAREQFDEFIDYKTTNTKELKKTEKQKTPWRASSVKKVTQEIERFFGFLVTEKNVPIGQISLLLLCAWPLVKAFLEFVRNRTGRTQFNHTQKGLVGHYVSWLDPYFAFLWREAEIDVYWKDKLPTTVTVQVQVAAGYVDEKEYHLEKIQQRWSVLVAQTVTSAKAFLRSQTFINNRLNKLARPFIKSKVALEKAGEILCKEMIHLPRTIESRSTAVQIRRLACAALQLVRAFRRGMVQCLLLRHVRIVDNTVIMDVPGEIVKNGKAIQGPLPAIPWVHEIVRRYLEEARPFIVGTGKDEKFFFAAARGGCKASHNVLYNDILLTLGVNPQAMRYVLVTDGKRGGASDEFLAKILVNTAEMIRQTYEQTDAEDHNAAANATVEEIFRKKRK